MLKLLRKDWILNRRSLLAAYALWSAVWLYGAVGSRDQVTFTFWTWTNLVGVACAFLPIMMVSREDKFRTAALACSLPVTRDAIVLSKYLGGWLVALGGLSVAVGAVWLLSAWGLAPKPTPAPMQPASVVAVIGVTIALMVPFVVRFGAAGVIALLVALQVAGILLLLAAAMFTGRSVSLGAFSGRIAAAATFLHASLGDAGFSALLVIGVVALNAASYRLAAWVYRRREF